MKASLIVVSFVSVLVVGFPLASMAENRNPTVGAAGNIEQLVLPGTELVAKPLVERDPIVIRIVNAFPHGDSFRYDIRFHGMEAGTFDLAKWLQRKDGSSTEDLPEIKVAVRSLLPPGQIEPNDLESGWLPRLGGYRNIMIAAVVLWILVLAGLIFLGRKKSEVEVEPEKQLTLADLLRARIEAAINHRMDPTQYAELERMLFAFWRKRLGLESVTADQAMVKIKENQDAGPLMKQLESWLHSPSPTNSVDLAQLLEPFRDMPADTPGFGDRPGFDS